MPLLNASVKPDPQTRYIQIGLETGQHSWEIDINSPIPNLLCKKHYVYRGDLNIISGRTLSTISDVAAQAKEHGFATRVVYEAGAFGQKLGRDLHDLGVTPVQLVARNVEYVRFGGRDQHIPKTDRIDSERQAQIPLDDPKLPYANVQTCEEEELRDLFKESSRLDKRIKATNALMCAILRTCHLDSRHVSVKRWDKKMAAMPAIGKAKQLQLKNLLSELKDFTNKKIAVDQLLIENIKNPAQSWLPPDPEAQPARQGRHPLQALGENSPLRKRSFPRSLLSFKGIGIRTMLMFAALIGDPRRFKNKKAFRAFLGLAPIPYRSCSMRKSMGMKRGNPQLRKLMIQLAWRWCRLHPHSHLGRKYAAKLSGTRRTRKIAVCALAGELAEMLYNHLVCGKEIPGVNLKNT